MTKFDPEKFDMGRGSERYVYYDGEGCARFVARFKHSRPAACARHFVAFLVKNFTVEEYFSLYESGLAPAKVLETKGFIDYHTARAMKAAGYTDRDAFIRHLSETAMARIDAAKAPQAQPV